MTLEIGVRGEATLVVGEEHTAEAFGAGGVRVFGTPMMIGLMENAAWRLVQPQLDEGDTTVGVSSTCVTSRRRRLAILSPRPPNWLRSTGGAWSSGSARVTAAN